MVNSSLSSLFESRFPSKLYIKLIDWKNNQLTKGLIYQEQSRYHFDSHKFMLSKFREVAIHRLNVTDQQIQFNPEIQNIVLQEVENIQKRGLSSEEQIIFPDLVKQEQQFIAINSNRNYYNELLENNEYNTKLNKYQQQLELRHNNNQTNNPAKRYEKQSQKLKQKQFMSIIPRTQLASVTAEKIFDGPSVELQVPVQQKQNSAKIQYMYQQEIENNGKRQVHPSFVTMSVSGFDNSGTNSIQLQESFLSTSIQPQVEYIHKFTEKDQDKKSLSFRRVQTAPTKSKNMLRSDIQNMRELETIRKSIQFQKLNEQKEKYIKSQQEQQLNLKLAQMLAKKFKKNQQLENFTMAEQERQNRWIRYQIGQQLREESKEANRTVITDRRPFSSKQKNRQQLTQQNRLQANGIEAMIQQKILNKNGAPLL